MSDPPRIICVTSCKQIPSLHLSFSSLKMRINLAVIPHGNLCEASTWAKCLAQCQAHNRHLARHITGTWQVLPTTVIWVLLFASNCTFKIFSLRKAWIWTNYFMMFAMLSKKTPLRKLTRMAIESCAHPRNRLLY